jgi:hypothetical protein
VRNGEAIRAKKLRRLDDIYYGPPITQFLHHNDEYMYGRQLVSGLRALNIDRRLTLCACYQGSVPSLRDARGTGISCSLQDAGCRLLAANPPLCTWGAGGQGHCRPEFEFECVCACACALYVTVLDSENTRT